MAKNLKDKLKNINIDALEEDMEDYEPETPMNLEAKLKKSFDNFNELLDGLSGTEDRRKAL
jgi:hypothetical protein